MCPRKTYNLTGRFMWDEFNNKEYNIHPLDMKKRMRVLSTQLYETCYDAKDNWSWDWYCLECVKLASRMRQVERSPIG